jgi:hypothetical protein
MSYIVFRFLENKANQPGFARNHEAPNSKFEMKGLERTKPIYRAGSCLCSEHQRLPRPCGPRNDIVGAAVRDGIDEEKGKM